MKTRFTVLLLLFLFETAAVFAQSIVSFDMIQRNMNINVKLTLKDDSTSEPLSWATVYLIPAGDTTITHFAISDDKGNAVLEEVPVGKYELTAEIIGYLPHRQTCTFKHWEEDLGIIRMKENPEYIEASKITAAGNPVLIKKDTIEYNASSFKVGENAMLEDLLKKMPGMEVSDDGSVTVNGEKVEQITVGGKTFFFNDPNAALKNLPAKIVDKIKVIDKKSEEAEFTGISTKDDKKKIMDVELKDEYTKGWFGNAKIGGGSTLVPKGEDGLSDRRGLLYNGNAMATGYTEKDQVVFIGNAYNATEPGAGAVIVTYGGEQDDYSSMDGLATNAKAGLNFNSDRIKGFTSTISADYSYGTKDSKRRTARTSFRTDATDILSDGTYSGDGSRHGVKTSIEFKKKDKKKYDLYLYPAFGFSTSKISQASSSRTYSDEGDLNSSSACSDAFSKQAEGSLYFGGGIKDLGKEKRSITLSGDWAISGTDGEKNEISELLQQGTGTTNNLLYNTDNSANEFYGSLSYVEPIAKRWAMRTRFSSSYASSVNDTRANGADGTEDIHHSSFYDKKYFSERLNLLMQYDNDTSKVQFGVQAELVQNSTRARSLGTETITGKGEWLMNWSPFVSYSYEKEGHSLYAGYSGQSAQVSGRSVTPAPDLSDPVHIQTGNIYLKPSFSQWLHGSYRMNNRETFSFLNLYINGSITNRSIVYASWFDEGGIRYAVPVNSMKPDIRTSMYLSFDQPLGKQRMFTLSANANASVNTGTGYQAASRLEGLDIRNFDYNAFMSGFWGDSSGDRFYSGESGFKESRTTSAIWSAGLGLKFSIEKLDAKIGGSFSNRISKYSLDKSANLNTWDNSLYADVLWQPGKNWELKTDICYNFYRGYSSGFGLPEWKWNASVSKSIKSVSLSLKVADILNQTRNLRRMVSSEYVEDVYRNVMGRMFLFSVSFNFGKMNAKKNSSVENAIWNMM